MVVKVEKIQVMSKELEGRGVTTYEQLFETLLDTVDTMSEDSDEVFDNFKENYLDKIKNN